MRLEKSRTIIPKNMETMLVSQIGDLKIKSIDTNILNTAIMKMLEKYSRSNVGMVYSLTGQFFDYLKLQGIIIENPVDNVMQLSKRKKVKELESIEELIKIEPLYFKFGVWRTRRCYNMQENHTIIIQG